MKKEIAAAALIFSGAIEASAQTKQAVPTLEVWNGDIKQEFVRELPRTEKDMGQVNLSRTSALEAGEKVAVRLADEVMSLTASGPTLKFYMNDKLNTKGGPAIIVETRREDMTVKALVLKDDTVGLTARMKGNACYASMLFNGNSAASARDAQIEAKGYDRLCAQTVAWISEVYARRLERDNQNLRAAIK